MNDTEKREFLPSLMTAAGYTRSSTELKGVINRHKHPVSHLEMSFIIKHLEDVYMYTFKTNEVSSTINTLRLPLLLLNRNLRVSCERTLPKFCF